MYVSDGGYTVHRGQVTRYSPMYTRPTKQLLLQTDRATRHVTRNLVKYGAQFYQIHATLEKARRPPTTLKVVVVR